MSMASALERWKLRKQQSILSDIQIDGVDNKISTEAQIENVVPAKAEPTTPIRRSARRVSALNAQRRLSLQLQPSTGKRSRRSSLAPVESANTNEPVAVPAAIQCDQQPTDLQIDVPAAIDVPVEVVETTVPEDVQPEVKRQRRPAWDLRASPQDQAAQLQLVRAAFVSNANSSVPCTPVVNNPLRRAMQQNAPRPSPLRATVTSMATSPPPQPSRVSPVVRADSTSHELSVLQARFAALEAELANTVTARDNAVAEVMQLRQLVASLQQQLQHSQQSQNPQPQQQQQVPRSIVLQQQSASTAINVNSAVRVYCRVRPPLENEAALSVDHRLVVSARNIAVVRREKSLQSAQMVEKSREFDLNCFGATSTQEEVFDAVKPLVRMAMEGKSACVFAYGQTASGKTFTMFGNEQALGVIPRAIDLAFAHAERNAARGTAYEFRVAYCELHCDHVYDLLSESRTPLALRQAGNNAPVTVVGLSWVGVATSAHLCRLIGAANEMRATATTNKNEKSSRSHTVLQIEVTVRNLADASRKTGVLSLIDLAGSERVSASGVIGSQLKETQAINASLAVLGDVVSAIAGGRSHVPFRESKLTRLLEPYLIADEAKTVLLVTLSPHFADASETLSSLQFAAKAANCVRQQQ